MAQVSSVSMQQAGIAWFSRSRRPTSRIAAGVERTTISTPRTRPMPPLQASRTVDAAKPPRRDEIESPAGSHGLPGRPRVSAQAGRPADDPQHDRLRPRSAFGISSAASPGCNSSEPLGSWRPDPDRISRPGDPPISYRPQVFWPAATSNCMTRSRTWTR